MATRLEAFVRSEGVNRLVEQLTKVSIVLSIMFFSVMTVREFNAWWMQEWLEHDRVEIAHIADHSDQRNERINAWTDKNSWNRYIYQRKILAENPVWSFFNDNSWLKVEYIPEFDFNLNK